VVTGATIHCRKVREVGLTDDERRRLEQLAAELSDHDPHLARVLSPRQPLRCDLRRYAIILLIIAPVLLVLGAATTQILIIAIGCLAMITATILLLTNRLRRRDTP
jgi:hypothetical protein